MKITVGTETTPIKAMAMRAGQVGRVIEGFVYVDHLILRTGSGFISLNDPDLIWRTECGLMVHLLPIGTTIKLELEI